MIVRVALSLLAAMLPGSVFAAGFEILVPHRAVYDVALAKAERRSGINAMSGRIVYEITGNECEGVSVRFRFVTNITTATDTFTTDQQTTTHESGDGNSFSFSTRSFVNEIADQTVQGNAVRTDDQIEVNLVRPQERHFDLGTGLFVSSHLVNVISRATAGETFLSNKIFDGSGDADTLLTSTVAIGREQLIEGLLPGENVEEIGATEDTVAWPVSISYFDSDSGSESELLPIYEVSFILHANGVSRSLHMQYPDYSLDAVLSQIDYLDNPPCQLEN